MWGISGGELGNDLKAISSLALEKIFKEITIDEHYKVLNCCNHLYEDMVNRYILFDTLSSLSY